MSSLKLSLLGAPQIELDGKSITIRRSKVLALLVYLAVSAQSQRRDTLATLLWPDNNQSQARTYLRNELSILNRTLGGAWLAIDGETIGLRPGVVLDVTQFQQQLTAFEQPALAPTAFAQPDGATSQRLSQVIALYRDDFLLGFTLADCPDFDEWQFFQTESLRQRLASALIALVALLQDQHAAAAAIPHARRWLALDPLHEPAHQTLMRLYALSGRQAAALRQFDECQRILQEELGGEPADETAALAVAIRTKQFGPAAPVTGIAAVDRPMPISAVDEPLSQAQPAEARPLFVGRESPLANLAQALAQAQRGQGQVRIITGEAGAGKSALVAEFLYRTAATSTALLVTVGACDAQTGVIDPYLPFRRALLNLLLGSAGANPQPFLAPTAKLQAAPQRHDGACRALLEHGPQLLALFLPTAAASTIITAAQRAGWQGELPPVTAVGHRLEQSQIFEQLTAVLRAVAAQTPLLLILEDLHWADSGSLALLARLTRQVAGHAILLIGTYRPEAVQRVPQEEVLTVAQLLPEVQRNLGEITIDLDATRSAEGRQLVDGIVDAEPNQLAETFRQALYHQTNGHPLFVIELIQDLKKSGALTQNASGAWVIGAALDWLNLPTRVEGAIGGRMAHLSADQRWWLTIAAVMGAHFLVEVVAHVAGVDGRELAQNLSRLLQDQHRLVEAEGVERLGGQRLTRYRFRHHLMQVYLYERLDEVQRVYLHEDVAQSLELLYGDQAQSIALPLAHHYQVAGVTQKAIDYLIVAGDQTRGLAANDEAVKHFRQAQGLLETLPAPAVRQQQAFEIQFNLGQLLTLINGVGSQAADLAYRQALASARQVGDGYQLAQVLQNLAADAMFLSKLSLAQRYAEECLRLAEASEAPELQVEANQALRLITLGLGQHTAAVAHCEQVVAFYQTQRPVLTFDDVAHLSPAVSGAGLSLLPLGYPDRALHQAQEGLRLAQQHNHQPAIASALGLLSLIHTMRGEWQAGVHFGEQQRALSTRYNFHLARTFGELHQGAALAMLGEVDAGLALVRPALAERVAMGVAFVHPTYLAQAAEGCGRAGRVTEGLALADAALAEAESTNDHQYEPKLHQIKGDLLLLQSSADDSWSSAQREAEACFRQAIAIAQSHQARLWEVRALASLCRLLHSQGWDEGCRRQLADLYAWFTEGFETEDLRVVQAVLEEIA